MIEIIKTSDLKNSDKKKIFFLKNQFWKYGLNNQKEWFNKNIKKNDLHLLIKKKSIILAYNCLRKKKINNDIYYVLDTIIVDKNFKKRKFGRYLMGLNKLISCLNDKPIFLKSNKKSVKFYKKSEFSFLIKKKSFFYFQFNNKSKKLEKFFKKLK